MKRKKVLLKEQLSEIIYNNDKIIISKQDNMWCFEIGREITMDIAEAVSILMRTSDVDDSLWEMSIDNIDIDSISPERSLFWLSGGYMEWRTLENYNKPWYDCYLDFQEEFGFIIINIIKRSKTLMDIKNNFNKYLNLPVLYEFALSKDLIR
jgi:hypothetical protein